MKEKLEMARKKTKVNGWKKREYGDTLIDTKNETINETINDLTNETMIFNKPLNGKKDKKQRNSNRSKRGIGISTGSNCKNVITCNIIENRGNNLCW